MKSKIFLTIAILILIGELSAQTITKATGSYCVNSETVFVLTGSCSSYNWSVNSGVNGLDYTIIGGNTTSGFRVKWLRTLTTSISCSYVCGSSGSTTSSLFTIGTLVTPAVALSLSSASVCVGSSSQITFTATPTNGGTPTYNWYVDGSLVSTGTSNTYSYSPASLSVGSHSAFVIMTSSVACVSSATAQSATQNFTVNAKDNYTVTVNGPALICSNSSTVSFFATVTNGLGTLTYAWYKNGVLASSGTSNMFSTTVIEGTTVYCIVSSNGACVNTPVTSNTYTAHITTAVTPTVGIGIPKTNFCAGENIAFSAISSYITGSSTYSWKLNGVQFSTASSPSLPVTTDVNIANAFSPGDVVTVVVSGLSSPSACLTSTTATASTASSPITVNQLVAPAVTLTADKLFVCQYLPVQFTAVGTFGGASPTYKLFVDGSEVSANVTGQFPTLSNLSPGTHTVYAILESTALCTTTPKDTSNILQLTVNRLPAVDAGPDRSITLPASTLSIVATVTDPEAAVPTYTWSKVSGSTATLTGNNTNTLGLSNLVAGTYVFQVAASDQCGPILDQVTVSVVYPNNNFNYVMEDVVARPGVLDTTTVQGLNIGSKITTVNYFDGLGRQLQTVNKQASTANLDVVVPVVYDAFGRNHRAYQPFTAESNGWCKPTETIISATGSYIGIAQPFYANGSNNKIDDDSYPYSETTFEPSPLNRPIASVGAGEEWRAANKNVQQQYKLNLHGTAPGQEKIIVWKLNTSTGLPERESVMTGVVTGGYYANGTLNINIAIDEEGNVSREYKDQQGRVILKKIMVVAGSTDLTNVNQWALTYYIYDGQNNLRYVLPPELSKLVHQNDTYNPTQVNLDAWAFQYKYDYRQRMVEKKVPGAGWVYMVYDWRDRLVMTQDGNQRAGATNAIKYWTFTKYDELNRPILTGIKDTTTSVQLTQAQMQAVLDAYYDPSKTWRKYGETYIGNAAGNVHGYSNTSYPRVTTAATLDVNRFLTVTYYDNYNFKSLWPTGYDYQTDGLRTTVNTVTYTQPANTSFNQRIVGQVTGTKTKVVEGSTNTGYAWLNSVNYFDDKYRVIQVKADNLKGGTDRVSTLYDFVGKVLKTQTTHNESDVSWIDPVNVIVSGNALRSTATTSGAASLQQLPAGVDGWLEVTFSENSTTRYIGLNDANPDAGYTNINYAFKFSGTGTVNVLENGTTKATISGVKPGEIFKIARTGTVVKYYRNGVEITLSPASTASSTLLMADASFTSNNATLLAVRTSFSTTSSTVLRTLEYDHAGRLTHTWHQLNNGANILLSKNEYNELGQLVDKKLHSTVAAATDTKQSVDYRYNIRGWLTSMNNASLTSETGINDEANDYFGMSLNYNTVDSDLGNSQLYNGNISAMKWSNYGDGTIKQKGYTYSYDPMNRITGSTFKEKTATWSALPNSGFAETGFTYDLNGNIKTLTRNDKRTSGLTMDILGYDYGATTAQSNRLLKVTDTGDDYTGFKDGTNTNNDYTYDANGNMLTDQNKGITAITYNHLNLPYQITKGTNVITYLYDAAGRKLAQVVNMNGTTKQTDYAGEFVYENDVLQFVSHEEGRMVTANTKLIYTNPGETTTDFSSTNATISTVTLNGTEKYVQLVSSGTTIPSGAASIGGQIPVVGGERYKIRVKGYHTNTNATAHPVTLRVQVDGVNVAGAGARLPKGVANDGWVEAIVTIPGTATQKLMQVGMLWQGTTALNETMLINEVEIVQLLNTAPEYQYNLKDHLGNTRLTFTTKQETISEKATMETANENTESEQFLYYDEAKKVNEPIFDKTNAGGTYYATRLTGGSTNAIYGLAKSISVMPGDVVNMEVYAKYVDTNTANWTAALTTLMTGIANGTAPAGVSVDGGAAGSLGGGSYPFAPLNHSGETGTAPKAYLNYIMFNKDMTTVIASSFARITTNSREYGQDVAHDRLALTYTVKEPGYMYIYLSNENPTAVEVYFDDFKVDHTKSPIVQVDDYYAFGLTYNSYSREDKLNNDFNKFQGQENVDDLGLNWDSFKWRNHQPDIGRFFNVDPLSEKYVYNSPYAFSENKVTTHIELEGLEAINIGIEPIDVYEAMIPKTEPSGGDKVLQGIGNMVFGTIGAIGTGAYIVGTESIGVALGGGTALSMSLGEVAIGAAQIVEGVSEMNGGNIDKTGALQGNSLLGVVAYGTNAESAPLIDAVGQFIPGTLSGGNVKNLAEGLSAIKTSENALEATKNVLNVFDAYQDTKGVLVESYKSIEGSVNNSLPESSGKMPSWQDFINRLKK